MKLHSKSTIILGTLFLLFTQKAASAGISISAGDIKELLALFQNNGFDKPTITFNETETKFDLSILGKPVNKNGSFDTSFTSDFWRGNLLFAQTDPLFASDTITASGNIFHQAGIMRPHPTDLLKGDIFTFNGLLINSSVAGSTDQNISKPFKGEVPHENLHSDKYEGMLDATVKASSVFGNNITGWTFTLKGNHLITACPIPKKFNQSIEFSPVQNSDSISCGDPVVTPEPSSMLGLFALGTLGAASTLKRKLKPWQSPEKETAKID